MIQNQSGNVLPGPNLSPPSAPAKKKFDYSALSVFLALILLVVMILLEERLMFDLNRLVNPVVDQEWTKFQNDNKAGRYGYQYETPKMPVRSAEMAMDAAGVVSNTRVYYPRSDEGKYTMYKLIIHAAIVIPLFILSFALFYFKKENKQIKPVLVSFMISAFWIMFHLLGEVIAFVMNQYRNIAIYIILILLTLIFGGLAYFVQARHSKEKEGAAV